MPTFKLTKKTLSHIFIAAFCLHVLRILTTTFPEEALKVSQHNFFQKIMKVVLLVIYLFTYDSSKSPFFMLNMAFDVLSTVFVI